MTHMTKSRNVQTIVRPFAHHVSVVYNWGGGDQKHGESLYVGVKVFSCMQQDSSLIQGFFSSVCGGLSETRERDETKQGFAVC